MLVALLAGPGASPPWFLPAPARGKPCRGSGCFCAPERIFGLVTRAMVGGALIAALVARACRLGQDQQALRRARALSVPSIPASTLEIGHRHPAK
jgi:hypothetical protein